MGLIDFNSLLFGPIYTVFSETAVLTPSGADEGLAISAIDKTSGVLVDNPTNVGVETIVPAAVIRMTELIAGELDRTDLSGAALTLNGKTWRVESYRMIPSPKGEADGEVMLFLLEDS